MGFFFVRNLPLEFAFISYLFLLLKITSVGLSDILEKIN